jgi:hypothetical protein
MINLFEIMQAAQGGNAYNNIANQFGIGPEQAQKAVEALIPAFSAGLQQQAQTMEGWQNILASLGQAQNSAQFFDSDGDGIPDHLEQEGQNALGTMFGTPETTQAIAQQAAQFAGLPATMMQQMLPVIASMVMGGLFKGAMNNGLGGILGQMMQGGMQQGGLGSILGGMFGQQMTPQQPQMGGMGGMGGLLGNILGSFMGGGRAPQPAPQPQDPMSAGLDMLKGMFQTGQQVQNSQMDAFQQILQQFNRR